MTRIEEITPDRLVLCRRNRAFILTLSMASGALLLPLMAFLVTPWGQAIAQGWARRHDIAAGDLRLLLALWALCVAFFLLLVLRIALFRSVLTLDIDLPRDSLTLVISGGLRQHSRTLPFSTARLSLRPVGEDAAGPGKLSVTVPVHPKARRHREVWDDMANDALSPEVSQAVASFIAAGETVREGAQAPFPLDAAPQTP